MCQYTSVFPVGRALKDIEKEDIVSTQTISRIKCRYDGMCSIDWDGNVLWCCSLHNKNMIIGNVKNENINSILNKFRNNKAFMCILTKGLPYLASIIDEHGLISLKKTYADGCEFCNSIFQNDSLLAKLEKIL